MKPVYNSVLINLDSRPERLATMQDRLAALGLSDRCQRLSAVVGSARPGSRLSPGAIGCFLSHRRALDMARPGTFLHILEDDVEISRHFDAGISRLAAAGKLSNLDLIFTGMIVIPNDFYTLRLLEAAYVRNTRSQPPSLDIINLKGFLFAGTGSYLVNPAALVKVSRLLDTALKGPMDAPIDLLYRKAIWDGHLRAGCLFPFLTATRLDATATSAIKATDQKAYLLDTFSTVFYLDADYESLAEAVLPVAENKRLDVIAAALRVMLSGDFKFD